MNIQQICDYIIILGTAYFMVIKFIDSFAKPTSKIKQKKQEKDKKQLKDVLKEVMPEYLEKHDLQTRDKYLADRQRYLQDIKNEILKETQTTLLEIKDINNNQNENISHISDIIDKLNNSSKDVLRQKIMAIYHANKKSRTLTIYDKEALTELYKDYKAQLGNSYIDKYYNRMITWKVIDEYDITE